GSAEAAAAGSRLEAGRAFAVQEFRRQARAFLRILLVGHPILAKALRQLHADEFLLFEDGPFAAVTAEVRGEFMELLALPHIARMIVTLSALNLDAEED